eukprot:29141-Pelagococcus_subviridis.AAC.3
MKCGAHASSFATSAESCVLNRAPTDSFPAPPFALAARNPPARSVSAAFALVISSASRGHQVRVNRVAVFIEEPVHVVGHFAGVVRHLEHALVPLVSRVLRVGAQLRGHLLRERVVRRFRERALLVQEAQDAHRSALDDVDARLIVLKVNLRPVDALALVLLLLELKHVLVELLLQALVRVVDAQLLERVLLEVLEAVDVENGHARRRRAPAASIAAARTQRLVDARDDGIKQRGEDRLRERVAPFARARGVQDAHDALPAGVDLARRQRALEKVRVDAQELRRRRERGRARGGHRGGGGAVRAGRVLVEVDVPEPQDRGDGLEDLRDLVLARTNLRERSLRLEVRLRVVHASDGDDG